MTRGERIITVVVLAVLAGGAIAGQVAGNHFVLVGFAVLFCIALRLSVMSL